MLTASSRMNHEYRDSAAGAAVADHRGPYSRCSSSQAYAGPNAADSDPTMATTRTSSASSLADCCLSPAAPIRV